MLCCGGCLVHWRMCNGIPGLYLLGVSNTPKLSQPKMSPDIAKCPSVQNHSWLRTIALESLEERDKVQWTHQKEIQAAEIPTPAEGRQTEAKAGRFQGFWSPLSSRQGDAFCFLELPSPWPVDGSSGALTSLLFSCL